MKTIAAIVGQRPFLRLKLDALQIPNRFHVRMGQIGEPKIGPDCFRNIHDDIALLVPRAEHTQLGFALRLNSAVKKPDSRVSSTRVRQHQKLFV